MNNQINFLSKQLQKASKEKELEEAFDAELDAESILDDNIQSGTFSHLLQTYSIGTSKSKSFMH